MQVLVNGKFGSVIWTVTYNIICTIYVKNGFRITYRSRHFNSDVFGNT